MEKDLYYYFRKKVKLKEKKGRNYTGIVNFYESDYYSGYGEPSIGLVPDLREFALSDNESIEVIDEHPNLKGIECFCSR